MTHNKPATFAVMGNPVMHSLSPWIHQYFARQAGIALVYEKIQAKPDSFATQVHDFFEKGGTGLNITAPFKEQAFALADKHTVRCNQAQAANTLWMSAEGLCADNTDGAGLVKDLSRYVQLSGASIAILGAGGATRGIIGPLLAAKPEYITVINRTRAKAELLQKHIPHIRISTFSEINHDNIEPFDLLIHATSASLQNKPLDFPASILDANTFCYDLSYDLHQPTTFIQSVQEYHCRAVDGLGMLVEQAAEAFTIWHGIQLEVDMQLIRQRMLDMIL